MQNLTTEEILQERLLFAPWEEEKSRRLPGIMPLEPQDWLQVDAAYSAQIGEKAALIRAHRDQVYQMSRRAEKPAAELLEFVLSYLSTRADFEVGKQKVTCPDGRKVSIDRDVPLLTLAQLVQEDFLILEKDGDEHVLTGALLCFPASWTLAEKFMQPLIRIHIPVDSYTPDIARRVQRLFDAVRPGRPLWRANVLFYENPALFQPRPEIAPRDKPQGVAEYVRSERQSLLRLPETEAVIFSVHTTLIRKESLTDEQTQSLAEFRLATQAAE